MLDDIGLIVYDFDGVFTDNRVILREDGKESVVVNRSDGLAVGVLKKLGIPQFILTTETNSVVKARAKKLGIGIKKGLKDKRSALVSLCKARGVPLKNVMFVGNDINDLEAMESCGYPVAPADAYAPARKAARIVTKAKGGSGVVRELLDILLK
jgi:3-deoxy-D-manno-octulosonate 8-phosphate phosphatase (KDO 8-P phosphatase)